MLKRAFQGGFTHANPYHADKVISDVTSFDFTSSYPAVMVSEKFPMSPGEYITITSTEQLIENLNYYCCVFDIMFVGLESKVMYDSYISESRCWKTKGAVYANNGRIVSADEIYTTITSEDYKIIQEMYTWKERRIGKFVRYHKGYLPRDFVGSILTLYANKTTLKGVKGKEVEYQNSKEMINAGYGMSVTDPVRDDHPYLCDEWQEDEKRDVETEIEKYNKSPARFLYYPWGVFITAYARRNLFSGILECKYDYIYSDTDSIKIRNAEKHKAYFEEYNRLIIEQLKTACDFHGFSYDLISPKTIKGIEKPLGVWDFDGHYSRFKTLGAKRYMVEYSDDPRNGDDCGKINLTVSGLNKKVVVPYLCTGWCYDIKTRSEINSPFSKFTNMLHIPKGKTGKLTHTYIDVETSGDIVDYLGNPGHFDELSSVHLEESDHTLSLSQDYIDYLLSIEME